MRGMKVLETICILKPMDRTAILNPPTTKSVEPVEHRAKSIQEHGHILRCIKWKQAEDARTAMREHIQRSKNNMLESFQKEEQP